MFEDHKANKNFSIHDFFGNFYSLKCVATSMNHNAFHWVEIATIIGGGGLGREGNNGLGWDPKVQTGEGNMYSRVSQTIALFCIRRGSRPAHKCMFSWCLP